MDAVSSANIRILLVDANPASLARVSNLLRSKYEVVTAANGEEALFMLLEEDHGITLMVTDINLPDICCFELIEIIERKTRLAIVVMCDTDDKHLIMTGMQNGAMLCLLKPLCSCKITDIWQLPILKRRQVMLESRPPLMSRNREIEPVGAVGPQSSCGSSSFKKRKMERGCGLSMGQSSQFVWSPHVQRRFMYVVEDLGISNATPSEVACRMNIPGVTSEHVSDKLKQLRRLLRRQLKLQLRLGYHPVVASAMPRNPPVMVGPNMGQRANNNHGIIHRQQGDNNPLTRYMQNPHSREQLKSIIEASERKWAVEHGFYANLNTGTWAINNFVPPPPARTTVFHVGLVGPPLLVPVPLAQHIERFIYNLLNAEYGLPGSVVAAPEPQRGAGPGLFEDIDADDMLGAIIELLAD